MTLYALSGLTRFYGSRCVLNIPRLELHERRIHALLGPNGAGKTTLMNLLAFLDTPSSGHISFKGQPVRFTEPELQPLRRQVVMVDQHPILFSTSVYKNIDFGLKIRGIDRAKRSRLIDEALDLVGMRAFAFAEAHKLSGGETQRVALARALALSPQVFLCDEPTANVDAENRTVIIDLLDRINTDKKMTVIFTTHDRSQAAVLADITLTLADGSPVETGSDNIFTAIVVKSAEGAPKLSVGASIDLPLPAEPDLPGTSSRVKVAINPAAIEIVPGAGESATDHEGMFRIVQVAQNKGAVRIKAAADVQLTVELGKEAYRQLNPMVGDLFRLKIPPSAVKFI